MPSPSVYDIITNNIITALDKGVVPWQRPWAGSSLSPRNGVTSRPYNGINAFLTHYVGLSQGYVDTRWVTFKQAQELGGTVKKGERGTSVIFWTTFEPKQKKEGEENKKGMVLRYYTVFNVEQCESLDRLKALPQAEPVSPIETAEGLIEAMPQRPTIEHKPQDRAYYSPAKDTITLPEKSQFYSSEEYYSTLFHELGHSTGHKDRLNREGIAQMDHFGSAKYSAEELVAELTSAFLCGHVGISSTLDNSVAYLNGWRRALSEDSRMIISAASKAQKAADFIRGEAA